MATNVDPSGSRFRWRRMLLYAIAGSAAVAIAWAIAAWLL